VEKAKFVVLDFVIQPHPEGFVVAKGRKIDKRRLKWEELTEKVRKKTSKLLKSAAISPQDTQEAKLKCEMEGKVDDEKGHAYLASLLIHEPTRQHILRIEDFLRGNVPTEGGDIPDDAQPYITVRVKDHQGRYLRFQVTDFTLSGPSGGDWKPFTQWYGAMKKLGLPNN